MNKMKSHLLKCPQCLKETKKQFNQSTMIQISTFDVVCNNININDPVQSTSNNYQVI